MLHVHTIRIYGAICIHRPNTLCFSSSYTVVCLQIAHENIKAVPTVFFRHICRPKIRCSMYTPSFYTVLSVLIYGGVPPVRAREHYGDPHVLLQTSLPS